MARNGSVAQQQQNNVWLQMSYTPPRGPCSHKSSILTSCPCYRFMLHPLKGSTSFDCDGCGHHASFHKMDNREDEESVRRWKEREQAQNTTQAQVMGTIRFGKMRAAMEEPQRGRIESREDVGSDHSLDVFEDVAKVTRPARKRKRAAGQ
ncbi:MAG: hypothetical protein Q9196_001306 [Gyalolechia fulgens]